jgi:hypothetical protein
MRGQRPRPGDLPRETRATEQLAQEQRVAELRRQLHAAVARRAQSLRDQFSPEEATLLLARPRPSDPEVGLSRGAGGAA